MAHAFALKNGTILLSTEAPGGLYNAVQLKKIATLCDGDVAIVKATEDQRLALFVKESDAPRIVAELKAIGLGIRHYQQGLHQPTSCIGELCPDHEQDALGSAMELTKVLQNVQLTTPLKIGVNGCAKCCVPCHTLDISIVGDATGYRVSLGGKTSALPEMASFMAEGVPAVKLPGLISKVVTVYQSLAQDGESLQEVMERAGTSPFVEALAPYSQDASGGMTDPFGAEASEEMALEEGLETSEDTSEDTMVAFGEDVGTSDDLGTSDALGTSDDLSDLGGDDALSSEEMSVGDDLGGSEDMMALPADDDLSIQDFEESPMEEISAEPDVLSDEPDLMTDSMDDSTMDPMMSDENSLGTLEDDISLSPSMEDSSFDIDPAMAGGSSSMEDEILIEDDPFEEPTPIAAKPAPAAKATPAAPAAKAPAPSPAAPAAVAKAPSPAAPAAVAKAPVKQEILNPFPDAEVIDISDGLDNDLDNDLALAPGEVTLDEGIMLDDNEASLDSMESEISVTDFEDSDQELELIDQEPLSMDASADLLEDELAIEEPLVVDELEASAPDVENLSEEGESEFESNLAKAIEDESVVPDVSEADSNSEEREEALSMLGSDDHDAQAHEMIDDSALDSLESASLDDDLALDPEEIPVPKRVTPAPASNPFANDSVPAMPPLNRQMPAKTGKSKGSFQGFHMEDNGALTLKFGQGLELMLDPKAFGAARRSLMFGEKSISFWNDNRGYCVEIDGVSLVYPKGQAS